MAGNFSDAEQIDTLAAPYFGVNTEVVWRTVQEDLPVIIPALKKMLGKK